MTCPWAVSVGETRALGKSLDRLDQAPAAADRHHCWRRSVWIPESLLSSWADSGYNDISESVVWMGGDQRMKLQIGQEAPEFTLPSHLDKKVTLSHLRGQNVVLAFFPLAWTPV
jgi:hypothetical protein